MILIKAIRPMKGGLQSDPFLEFREPPKFLRHEIFKGNLDGGHAFGGKKPAGSENLLWS